MNSNMKKQSTLRKLVKYLTISALLYSSQNVQADQPVHCLREDVYGIWDFHVSKQEQDVNVFEAEDVCTHKVPNRLQFVGKDLAFSFAEEEVWRINLKDDYSSEGMLCLNSKSSSEINCGAKEIFTGKWTPIYAQGMLVELSNGMRFITNFRYNLKDNISKDPLLEKDKSKFQTITTNSEESFQSACDKTMVGFVQKEIQNKNHPDTLSQLHTICFFGQQIKHFNVEKTEYQYVKEKDLKKNKIISRDSKDVINLVADNKQQAVQVQNVAQQQNITKQSLAKINQKRSNLHLEHVPSDEMDLLISTINAANLGWKASTCKLQKSHQDYGKGENCDENNLAQIDSKQGEDHKLLVKKFGDQDSDDFKNTLAKAQKYQKTYKDAQMIPDSEIPAEYDFRWLNGYDFTNPVRDQGHCGSCYTVAFSQAVEARLKLKYGKPIPMISSQQILQCNFMNEGCEGGWPQINSFFMERAYMVSEDCAPYKGKTKGGRCGDFEKCKPLAKIDSTHFVGGGWAEVSEKQMMKEILMNGPVPVQFQANRLFSTYKSGVLSEEGIKNAGDLSSKLQQIVAMSSDQQIQALSALFDGLFLQTKSVTDDKLIITDQSDLNTTTSTDQSFIDQAQDQILSEINKEQDDSKLKNQKLDISTKTMSNLGYSWENQNHSVMIVGWGFDEKTQTKYWIVRNSYAYRWGMNGDFLLRRGQNDFGIEADLISFDPVLCSELSSTQCIKI